MADKVKYQVLARRYRPQRFSDVVGQQPILQTLKNALRRDLVAHAYLFCGSRGVGKTTLARLFAKALNCTALSTDAEPCNECPSCIDISSAQSLDVIEIDGASNRGIDDIRQINETVGFAPSFGKYKIYIIDEVHMLTKEAFNALLKTLEEPPEKAKFFFATTEVHKVLPTILSRCQRFDLGRLLPSQIIAKLETIAKDLSRTIDPEALHLIAHAAEGSLRDAESLFDQVLCYCEGLVSAAEVRNILGLASQELFFTFDKAFAESRLSYAFELVEQLFQSGKDLGHFLEQHIEHYRHLSVCKTLSPTALQMPAELSARYAASAALYTQQQCLAALDILVKADAQLSRSTSVRTAVELALLQVLRTKQRIPIEALIRRLSELEETLLQSAPVEAGEPRLPIQQIKPSAAPSQGDLVQVSPSLAKSELEEPLLQSAPVETGESRLPIQQIKTPTAPSQESTVPVSPSLAKSEMPNNPVLTEKPKEGFTESEEPPLVLKEVPFYPTRLVEAKSAPANPADSLQQTPLVGPQTNGPTPPREEKHPSHYDTLIRFAAVELEGTVKT